MVEEGALFGNEHELCVLYGTLKRRFREANLPTPDLDARLLVTDTLEVTTAQLVANPRLAVTVDRIDELERRARQRLEGRSIGRILGRRAFWSLDLRLNSETLEPRPETETVVELALAALPGDDPCTIADLGVGTGAILLAILSERANACGVGVDMAMGALREAKRNAERNNVDGRCWFVRGNFGASLARSFDVIVSNPPYIETKAIAGLCASVRNFDPLLALDGGADGLDAYRSVFAHATWMLKPSGTMVVEIHPPSRDAVIAEATRRGLTAVTVANDLSGAARAISMRLADA